MAILTGKQDARARARGHARKCPPTAANDPIRRRLKGGLKYWGPPGGGRAAPVAARNGAGGDTKPFMPEIGGFPPGRRAGCPNLRLGQPRATARPRGEIPDFRHERLGLARLGRASLVFGNAD